MKRLVVVLLALLWGSAMFAQGGRPRWTGILDENPATFQVRLVSATAGGVVVNVQVPGFYTSSVTTPRGEAVVVTVPKAVSTAEAGEPEMPMTGIPAIIGEGVTMAVRVLEARYMDFEGVDVAPSKGDLPRSVDPATVPYTYAECYDENAFFPARNVELYEPYVLRDLRGQNIAVYPFAYNPATRTLRVYYDMTIETYEVGGGKAAVEDAPVRASADFMPLYQRHFINYQETVGKYTPVGEEGDLLIICYDPFYDVMTDFVNWKRTRGLNTTMVPTSAIGTNLTYTALKEYISEQYAANNNLTHVLLVGGEHYIPGHSYSDGSQNGIYSGKGDNPYGQIVGSDIYNDLFIGRFSANLVEQVATQVAKVIAYERDLTTADTWCQNALGISRHEGNTGHYGEDDYEHIENLRTDLLGYGYTTVYQDYYNVAGYPSSTVQTISGHVNSGVGFINYCNHGSETAWQSHVPYYSKSHVNGLTNVGRWPFVVSTACLNGKYDHRNGCFAEAWMQATDNTTSAPTGAVGTLMSYISQPWQPPMYAQDEFVDILVESYSQNIKRTWGGTAINAILGIFNNYSTNSAPARGTYQAWILYGDPSMMLRTKTPQAVTVEHNGSIEYKDTAYVVRGGADGALATITDAAHNIVGRAVFADGVATISLGDTLTVGDTLTLCIFGYNLQTYLANIPIVAPSSESFAWQSEKNIMVKGNGPLRVFDLSGHLLSTVQVNEFLVADHNQLGIPHPGVYLLSLGGKTLKMFVK